MAVAVGGCGDVGAERRDGPPSFLVEGRDGDVRLAGARGAAWTFARGYAATLRDPGAPVHAATAKLRRNLAAQRARFARPPRGPSVGVVAVLLDPRGRSRVEATMILRARGERAFPITFALRRMDGRWLATELVGN